MTWDLMIVDARLATMVPSAEDPLGVVEDAAIAIEGGRIAWLGPMTELPADRTAVAGGVVCAGGRWVLPGLIDCHTHLVYGGNRAREFELRLEGASYEEIARAGGGIRSTVGATRAAGEAELLRDAQRRLDDLLTEGVTTIEIKSGYGLDPEGEVKQLRVARRLATLNPGITVRTTYLGAHALPEEWSHDRSGYIDSVAAQIPSLAAQGLADAVDAFCEGIAFQPDEVARVFESACAAGLPVKLHADQLSDLGGAALAARFGALSADHLEYTNESGVAAMAEAGTVAVILPGAFYTLHETRKPPIEAFRHHGVPIALATDCNPGSSPISSLLLILNMGCTLFGLTTAEALAGVTREAARALGLQADRGTLELGKRADLGIWEIERPAELAYRVGSRPLAAALLSERKPDLEALTRGLA